MVLASASLWSTLLLSGKRCSRLWWLSWGAVVTRQSTEAFEELPFLGLLALFALGNMVHYCLLTLYLAVLCAVFECCLWSAGSWILREMPWCFWAQCLS